MELHPLVMPLNLEVRKRQPCILVATLQAQSSEGDSAFIRMRISWDGKWHDGAQEMRNHFKVDDITAA
jgi:hypothetical protein